MLSGAPCGTHQGSQVTVKVLEILPPNYAQGYTSHPVHILPVFCASPPPTPSRGKSRISNAPLPRILKTPWKAPCLLHLEGICRALFLHASGYFPSKVFSSCSASKKSHLAGATPPPKPSAHGSCAAPQNCCSSPKVFIL